jgi:hypothetical protein
LFGERIFGGFNDLITIGETNFTLEAEEEGEYKFICIATDTAGNAEMQDPIPETSTILSLEDDEDNDKILDENDFCPNTQLPEQNVTSKKLHPNHFAAIDEDGVFETLIRIIGPGEDPEEIDSKYTLEDTKGCSCEQILELKPGKNKGEKKYGCTKGTMDNFIDMKGWAKDLFE